MYDHVTIRVSSRESSEQFYETVLRTLGIDQTYSGEQFAEWDDFSLSQGDDERPARGRASTRPSRRKTGFRLEHNRPDRSTFVGASASFILVTGTPTEHVHLAFGAGGNATVEDFHRAATEAGYRDNGAPGERPIYHDGYFGAFVLDPDSLSTLPVRDFEASKRFYRQALAPFGVEEVEVEGAIGWGPRGRVDLFIRPGEPTAPLHVAFAAADRATVDAFHAAALAAAESTTACQGSANRDRGCVSWSSSCRSSAKGRHARPQKRRKHVRHVLGARTPRVDARVDGPRRAVLRLLDPDCGPCCRVAGLTGAVNERSPHHR